MQIIIHICLDVQYHCIIVQGQLGVYDNVIVNISISQNRLQYPFAISTNLWAITSVYFNTMKYILILVIMRKMFIMRLTYKIIGA